MNPNLFLHKESITSAKNAVKLNSFPSPLLSYTIMNNNNILGQKWLI
jgi:hypothetical protein